MPAEEKLELERENLIQRVEKSQTLFLDEASLAAVKMGILSASAEVIRELNSVLDDSDIKLESILEKFKKIRFK